MDLPLIARKRILKSILGNNKNIIYCEHFTNGVKLFEQVQLLGLEGIVSKKMDSKYIPGYRGDCWFKTPTFMEREFIIIGWVESERGRAFGAILFGAYNKQKQLHWIGHSGGSFKDREITELFKKLKALEVKRKPFVNRITEPGVYHWVKPSLVASFKFPGYTKNNRIRKPAIYRGLTKTVELRNITWDPPIGKRSSDLFF